MIRADLFINRRNSDLQAKVNKLVEEKPNKVKEFENNNKNGTQAAQILNSNPAPKCWILRYSQSSNAYAISYKVGGQIEHKKVDEITTLDSILTQAGLSNLDGI